jgi:hypothetical protein
VGSLFLYDDLAKDAFVLNGALAGLEDRVDTSCSDLEELDPHAFADGRVLFSYGHKVYVWDPVTERRTTVAIDGQSGHLGGPHAAITADGHLLAYRSNQGTVVLKAATAAPFSTKTTTLTKVAAEANSLARGGRVLDLALSGDGHYLVVNIEGILFLYDVGNPHLYQVVPLSGEALSGATDGVAHLAISRDGHFVAATVAHQRLLVYDSKARTIDTVPYANMGLPIDGVRGPGRLFNPVFDLDDRTLLFETRVGKDVQVWSYDLLSQTLRGQVILNGALGNAGNTLVSNRGLDP